LRVQSFEPRGRPGGPATHFATLAKSFGIYGEGPLLDPEEIRPVLERGLKVVKENGTPALIDTVTQPR
jgi:acetolactate synthase I/II/III large subunit